MFKKKTLSFMAIAMMVLMLALTLGACEAEPAPEPKPEKVAAPVANPPGGTYSGIQLVMLVSATEVAAIYYTTNGSTPIPGGTIYSWRVVECMEYRRRFVQYEQHHCGNKRGIAVIPLIISGITAQRRIV